MLRSTVLHRFINFFTFHISIVNMNTIFNVYIFTVFCFCFLPRLPLNPLHIICWIRRIISRRTKYSLWFNQHLWKIYTETMRNPCFLACLPQTHIQPPSLHHPGSPAHSGFGSPTSTKSPENATQTCLRTSTMEAAPQLRSHPSRRLQFVSGWQSLTSTAS